MNLLITREFHYVNIDFYVDSPNSSDFWVTREQIGRMLNYRAPERSIRLLQERFEWHFNHLYKEVELNIRRKGICQVVVYNFDGLLEICSFSGKSRAAEVVNFLWQVKHEIEYDLPAVKSELQLFSYGNQSIRLSLIDGEVWFVGKDIAEALGYSNTKDALIAHVDAEDKRIIQKSENATLGIDIPNRGLTVINESGMYSLIFASKLPSAKQFKHWVTSEVLPSIRKTGGYATPEAIYKTLIEPKNLIIVLETLAEEQAKNKKLTAENAVLSVKAKYYDAILASSEALPITQIAKDYGMSAVTLNRLLSEMEIQYKRCGTWILYQDYADKGYTQTKTFIINEKQTKSYTTWTQKGRLFLYNLLKAHGIVPMCEREELHGLIV